MSKGITNNMEMEEPFYVRRRPDPVPFSKFLYNSDKGTIMGRTKSSWAKISFFYLIFYACLACLVAFCMFVFLRTLDPRIPKWKLHESLIGTNPGLGFRPMPSDDNVESTLIWYHGTNKTVYGKWTSNLDNFLNPYKVLGTISGQGQNIYKCDFDLPPPKGQVCAVEIEKEMGPCTKENNYGYHKNQPCIFLKLNRIFGWIPSVYNDPENLPQKMPKSLKEHINYTSSVNNKELNTIWVSCEGENPADLENIGPIKYYPRQGFPAFYFPYENSEGYLSPLVAVHFQDPVRGIIINIECKAWAKNIKQDRADRLGSVHFELMID